MKKEDINLLSEEEQIEIIKDELWKIKYIKNPSLGVQLTTININSYAIRYIKDPWYEVQLAAIQQNHNYTKQELRFIKRSITYPDLLELLELKILACEE